MRNDAERLAMEWGVPLVIAILAVGVRLVMSVERQTIGGILRGIFIGLFVGSMANLYFSDYDLGYGTKGALIGLCVVISEDLIVALIKIGKYIRNHPENVVDFIINRGRKK